MHIITRKYCEKCGREIIDSLKERRWTYDNYKVNGQYCIFCMNQMDFERR